jgi:hypothetical protein
MPTLATKLDQYEWWFFENGGMHIYNELKRIVTAERDGGSLTDTTVYGPELDYATNFDPPVVDKNPNSTPVGFTDIATVKNGGRPPTQAV